VRFRPSLGRAANTPVVTLSLTLPPHSLPATRFRSHTTAIALLLPSHHLLPSPYTHFIATLHNSPSVTHLTLSLTLLIAPILATNPHHINLQFIPLLSYSSSLSSSLHLLLFTTLLPYHPFLFPFIISCHFTSPHAIGGSAPFVTPFLIPHSITKNAREPSKYILSIHPTFHLYLLSSGEISTSSLILLGRVSTNICIIP